jgi:hypothetical protein
MSSNNHVVLQSCELKVLGGNGIVGGGGISLSVGNRLIGGILELLSGSNSLGGCGLFGGFILGISQSNSINSQFGIV